LDKNAGLHGNSTGGLGKTSEYTRRLTKSTCKTPTFSKALKAWRRRSFNNWKLRTAILQIILLELEMAHERRTISQEELEFKKFLKSRLMGAIIQKCQVFI
jgi:hypothetical protein